MPHRTSSTRNDYERKIKYDWPKGNSIELSAFLKYGLTKVKKAPSQMFDLVLNIPLNITLHLTFFKRT